MSVEGHEPILATGFVLEDRYEILGEIGAGSHGRVYRARQLSTAQAVAVKMLRTGDGGGDPGSPRIERFRRELAICGSLNHPHIVRLVDSGESEAGLFAVFEFVPGDTLARTLAREGALEVREALRVMGQVLDALACAHASGITHRDLKPANIMLGRTGARRNALVLDFGLGGLVEGAQRRGWGELTHSHEFLGTPFYAAPEQLAGTTTRPSADLYSWGLILLECLTGTHPFEDAAAGPPWREAVPIPDWLRNHPLGHLLASVLEPDVERRPASAADLLDALEQIAREEPPSTPEKPSDELLGEKRPVALVSCHLALRGPASRTLDIEERDAILREQHALCQEIAQRGKGRIVSTLGDRVLLCFGLAQTREDDGARAASAAVAIAEEIQRRAEQLRSARGVVLEAKLGVHAGLELVRGARASHALDAVNESAEIATSLDALAEPGQVLVSDALRGLLRGRLHAEPHGEARLGGAAALAPVYRLRPGPAEAPGRVDTPLVGRAAELDQLEESWRQASQGSARAMLIQGEAGIGKSRLLRELRQRIPEARWLECRCFPESCEAPLRPLIDLLSSVAEPAEALFDRYGMDAEQSALLGALHSQEGGRPDLPHSRELQKELTLGALASLLFAMAQREAIVFAVEDLQWADPTTLELLVRLVQELAAAQAVGGDGELRLMALFTARPEFAAPWPAAAMSTLALPGLTRPEVEAMIAAGLEGVPALPSELVETVVHRADGVPLFVEEVTRVLGASRRPSARGSQATELAAVEIPGTLRGLLVARLDALVPEAGDTAQLAAAMGREFDFELLHAVSDRSEASLRRELAELARAGILFPRRGAGRDAFVFKHALVRDAAYESMLRPNRRLRHARIADALLERFPEKADSRPDLVAQHLAEADRPREGAEWWKRAGNRATSRGALVEAIRHFENGLGLLERCEPSRGRAHLELELTESLGTALFSTRGYGVPEVDRAFSRARELCQKLGEGVPLRVLWGTWMVQFVSGSPEGTAELRHHLARHAERSPDPVSLLAAHTAAAQYAYFQGEFERSLAETEAALRQYPSDAYQAFVQEHGNDIGMYSFALRMVSLSSLGFPGQAVAVRDEMLELAEKSQNPYSLTVARGYAMNLTLEGAGDSEQALALADRQIALATGQRLYGYLGPALCTRGVVLARMGKHAEGLAAIEQGLALTRGVGLRSTYPYLLALSAEAHLLAGSLEEGLTAVQEGLALGETLLDRSHQPDLLRLKGDLLRMLGRPEEAERALREALRLARSRKARAYELRAAMGLTRLLSERGEPAAARTLLREAYAWVSEGADMRDARQARALLTELA